MVDSDLVSVVIPSYNRIDFLKNAINSIQNQTYSNYEIIVVNDGSTQAGYYDNSFPKEVKIINLETNQKDILGYVSNEYVRNFGIKAAQGKYIAFLDDDDIWMPEKLEIQLEAMKESGIKFSSTEGFYGEGVFNKEINYQLYNNEKYLSVISKKYSRTKFSSSFLERIKGKSFIYPDIWTYDFLKIHNCVITSSVVVEKSLMNALGGFRGLPTSLHADYDCWLGLLKLTNLLYVNEPLFYYDGNHGIGQNWK
jgi:glycosyltransferase involved in cell wall biosynthesis